MKVITPDTARELRALLDRHSRSEKHIGYHILPERLNALVGGTELANRYTFWERERWAYFREQVDFRGKSVLDIGCNIGYFLMSALDAGAVRVTGYEGKASCGEFLSRAIGELGEEDRFTFHGRYHQFGSEGEGGHHDVGLLLNVLHHLGHDYGDGHIAKESAKAGMLEQLNGLSRRVDTLIFQLGFNWKGDRHSCLFEHGTKAEMIDFVTRGIEGHWTVQAIGVPEKSGGGLSYVELSAANIGRVDALGEFLNRPIFVLRSVHAC
jgi:hypothetical protein